MNRREFFGLALAALCLRSRKPDFACGSTTWDAKNLLTGHISTVPYLAPGQWMSVPANAAGIVGYHRNPL